MRVAFLGLLVVLCISLAFCLRNIRHTDSKLTAPIQKLVFAGLLAVLTQFFYVWTQDKNIAMISYSIFSGIIDFLLVYLFNYVYIYTQNEKWQDWKRELLYILGTVDIISMWSNAYFHHAYDMTEKILKDGSVLYVIDKCTLLYNIHLIFSYIVVTGIFFLLIRKVVTTSYFYRKRYTVILALFVILIALDATNLFQYSPINLSILFYGILAIAISYYSLYYSPNDLIARMLALAVKDLNNGIMCFDDQGACIYSNTQLWNMYDVEPDEKLAEEIFALKEKELDDTQKQCYSWSEECEIKGEKRMLVITRKNVKDSKDNIVGCCFTIEDHTEQIREYQTEAERAKEASQAKSEFLSRVSHEIRTPVNAIYGMTEMILRESGEEQVVFYADEIKRASQMLMGIINDVLDFSRIESGKMTIVEADYSPHDMFENLINMITSRAKEKEIAIKAEISEEIPVVMHGDRIRLEQIILNLLTNAVKYTNEGTVTLRASTEVVNGVAVLKVMVEDTGIGIKEEDMPKLLTAFERLEETRNHSIQGTGLGLNITNLLLAMMDSGLKIESEYGKGSRFSFKVLQEVVDETPMGPLEQPKRKVKKNYEAAIVKPDAKVLMVDDNTANRIVFKGLLKQTKIQITDVDSGAKCLELIKANKYDIIFLDHMMPEMDGVETFKKMKEMDHLCKKTPVVMLTANAIDGAKEQYLEQGFDDFLSKPIIPAELEAMLAKYLS